MDAKWYDSGDPAFHDLSGDRAVAAIVRRHEKWLALQDATTRALFCSHAKYVGHNGALRYRCAGCVEELGLS